MPPNLRRVARRLHSLRAMVPYVEVAFSKMSTEPGLEAVVHRWVARLECENVEIVRAMATIGRSGRKRTIVSLNIVLPGREVAAEVTHDDPYVAISDAFRAARRQALQRLAA